MATAQPKERIVPLTDRAKAEFEKLLAKSEDDNVFPYRSVKKSWATVCRTAGVKGFWLRWLRDEAENHWREAGMHPLDMAYLMGQASPRTTMIYNNPRLEEMRGQMGAAICSKIVAIAPSKAWERRIRTRVDETSQWNLVGESPTWAKP
jgi:integrase